MSKAKPAVAKQPDSLPLMYTEKVDLLAEELGLDMGLSLDELKEKAIQATNDAFRRAVHSGIYFLRVKDELPEGEFAAWLQERDMPKQRAYEAMKIASFSAMMPVTKRKQLMSMGTKKVLAIASAESEVIDALIEEQEAEDVTDLGKLSVRELRSEIKNLRKKFETSQLELEEEKRKAKERFSDLPLPHWACAIREEGAVHGDTALRALDGLEEALQQLHKYTNSKASEEDQLAYNSAAAVAYHQLVGVLNRANALFKFTQSFLPKDAANYSPGVSLSEKELQQLDEQRQRLMSEEDMYRRSRAANRHAKFPSKGRPSKNPPTYPAE